MTTDRTATTRTAIATHDEVVALAERSLRAQTVLRRRLHPPDCTCSPCTATKESAEEAYQAVVDTVTDELLEVLCRGGRVDLFYRINAR